jgi:hypothetical protein
MRPNATASARRMLFVAHPNTPTTGCDLGAWQWLVKWPALRRRRNLPAVRAARLLHAHN